MLLEDSRPAVAVGSPEGKEQAPRDEVDRYRMLDPYSPQGKRERRRRRRPAVIAGSLLGCLAIALVAVFAVANLTGPNLAGYGDEPIIIEGLAPAEFTITPSELAEYDCVSESFEGQGQAINGQENIKKVTAYGPLLADFVVAQGASLDQFTRVIAFCKDDYNVILTPEMLESDIVMSIAQGNNSLEERHQPMRLVIPSEESGKWAYGVTRLVFEE